MRIDPAIAKLVADPAPLFGAGEAVRGWSEDPAVAPLLAELGRYGSGTALSECPGLSGLIAAGAEGAGFARRAAGVAAQHLRAEPLALWPWRHFSNGVLHSVTIAADGDASLSLAVVDGAPWFAARDPLVPDLAAFQPGTLHAVVVGGTASGRIMRNRSDDPARAQIESQPIAFAPGTAFTIAGEREALALDAIGGLLMTLRLYRRPAGNVPARQYDVASGMLVHQAAGEQSDSRAELMMALLRAMERSDAAPALAALARSGAPPARWQALRECLALDSAAGFAALVEVAAQADDPLCAPARSLAETLAAQHPALARMREELLCRA